jgi:hypothetical protein
MVVYLVLALKAVVDQWILEALVAVGRTITIGPEISLEVDLQPSLDQITITTLVVADHHHSVVLQLILQFSMLTLLLQPRIN